MPVLLIVLAFCAFVVYRAWATLHRIHVLRVMLRDVSVESLSLFTGEPHDKIVRWADRHGIDLTGNQMYLRYHPQFLEALDNDRTLDLTPVFSPCLGVHLSYRPAPQ